MQSVLPWLKANASWLIPLALYALANVANKLTGEPKIIAMKILDVISLLTSKGSTDAVKLPIALSKMPEIRAADQVAPVEMNKPQGGWVSIGPLIAILLTAFVLFGAAISMTGCAWFSKHETTFIKLGECLHKDAGNDLIKLVIDGWNAATGQPADWASWLAVLAQQEPDVQQCVMAAVLSYGADQLAKARIAAASAKGNDKAMADSGVQNQERGLNVVRAQMAHAGRR